MKYKCLLSQYLDAKVFIHRFIHANIGGQTDQIILDEEKGMHINVCTDTYIQRLIDQGIIAEIPQTFDCGVLGELSEGEMELLYTAPYSAHGDTADDPFNELLFKIRCKAKIVLDIG